MKRLTEQQVRQVIREELEQYLVEEGLMDLRTGFFKRYFLPGVLLATMLNLIGPQDREKAMGMEGFGGGSLDQKVEDVLTIDQMLDEIGMKKDILSQLDYGLKKDDKEKVVSLFKQMKDKQQEINDARKSGATEDEIKKLETEKSNIFSDKNISDPEQLQRILDTGSAIFRFIENAKPEELESIGNVDSEELLLKLQAKALRYSMSVEGRQKMVIHGVQQDLIDAKNAIIASGYEMPQEETVNTNFDLVVYYILDDLAKKQEDPTSIFGDSITVIEALRYLIDNNVIREEDSELIKNFDEEKYNKEFEGMSTLNMPMSKALQMYAGSSTPIQENKINKLRQRLNELRGVYV